MDQASRITGMQWQSNPYSILAPSVIYDTLTNGNRVEVRRYTGSTPALPQQLAGRNQLLTVTPSGVVVELPSRVSIPGRSSQLPVTIVEPISRPTMNRMAAKALRALPLVGTALQIYDLAKALDEMDLEVDSQGQLVTKLDARTFCGTSATSYSQWRYFIYQTVNEPGLYTCSGDSMLVEKKCLSENVTIPDGYVSYNTKMTSEPCFSSTQVNTTFVIYYFSPSSTPSGAFLPSQPQSLPVTDDELQAKVASLTLQTLVNLLNSLPSIDRASDVIDIYARELKDDPVDHRVRLGYGPTSPTSVQVGEPATTTTTRSDGSTVTTTTTTTATADGNTVIFNTRTEVVTRDAQGNVTDRTVTETTPTSPSNPNAPHQEDLECGLPDTPPCKIDETGTPAPPHPDEGRQLFDDLLPQCIKSGNWRSCFPQLPEINWTFQVPTGCSVIPLPGYEKLGLNGIDICRFQPIIHDLMSMLWAGAGLFGAVSILGRRKG
ncbi:hypothetical protein Talka_00395 [Tepidimonas alkaliphilus]|uniref:Neisseria meningitidis TspB protein n=2 Tax=Tepidimonas alkaliphilus TaxID=2588942 RepID=A0A554WDQ2_9BURK|nr:hypothetical protein Talka_00389 [Tepidimonas alkaliphilus]TSE21715.1 hypothetical protein Talka_00395 [Tepidimonas alkaliphilus]